MAAPMIEKVATKMISLRSCPCRLAHVHLKQVRPIHTTACVGKIRELEKDERVSDFRLIKIRPTERDFLDPRERAKLERESRKREHVDKHPRYMSMRTDQDWTNVWPTAKSFNWSVVPLPVRQGAVWKACEGAGDNLALAKPGNLELMKIPNFLHLTPRHIRKHCEAIKPFFSKWPEELKTDADVDYHFPMEVVTSDYCFAGPSVRDPRARVVTVKYKLSELELDEHARDKYLKLVGPRYNPKTGVVTLTSDRCPLKKQNYDYIQYLMTALYFESWKTEAWEKEITEEDHLEYAWYMDDRRTKILTLLQSCKESDQASTDTDDAQKLDYVPTDLGEDSVASLEPVKKYAEAVEELVNEGENYASVTNYKQAVMQMLNVKTKLTTEPEVEH